MSDSKDLIEIPSGTESPLAYALHRRDANTLAMVGQAVAERRVVLAYQPVVRAENPDQPAFFEGLMRIRDPQGRIIPAREFMDVVETIELGRKIDCLAIEMGLATLEAEPTLRLAINMSARSIGYPAWMKALRRGLARDPTVGERLILEITEASAMVMPDLVGVFMNDLRAEGVSFALDDFGAGYTSFRYLRQFTFDMVKIDIEFIRGIADDADNQVLTEALVSIARHFDMFTVAEGVESARDAEFLTRTGVDCLQGYHFGAPALRLPWRAKEDLLHSA